MKFSTLIITLALCLFGTSAVAQSKIAYVNIQEALATIQDGKKVQEKLESILKAKQEALIKERAEIQKKGEELQKQKAMMSPEAFQKEAQALQKNGRASRIRDEREPGTGHQEKGTRSTYPAENESDH